MSREGRGPGGARPGAGRKPKVAYDAKTLLSKDFKSIAEDMSDENLPPPQPWHLLQTATQAYEKADKKFATAIVQLKHAKTNLGHVAGKAERAQNQLRQCMDKISQLQDLYDSDPVNHQDEFLEMDDLQTEKTTLESKLVALAEQVASAEDEVTTSALVWPSQSEMHMPCLLTVSTC